MSRPFPLWRMPLLLAALTLFGLLDALLVDNGAARAVAWIALGVPIVIAIRCGLGGRRRAARPASVG